MIFMLRRSNWRASCALRSTPRGFRLAASRFIRPPRRLAVVVEGVPERTEKIEEVFRGPAAKIAFDADGNPTKAALGFARGKGVDASALERRDENGVEYVYAVKQTPERDVAELLPGILGGVITTIQWPKAQRWGSRSEQFSRPVRWLLALFGDEVVPLSSRVSSRAIPRAGIVSSRPVLTRSPMRDPTSTCCAAPTSCRARRSARSAFGLRFARRSRRSAWLPSFLPRSWRRS